MQPLNIPETKHTPSVCFNLLSGTLDIKGKSIPEDAYNFYKPLMNAIDNYHDKAQPVTTLNFTLYFFNTSSSKCLLKILSAFSAMHKRVTQVKVNWYYLIEDEDMLETANDLESSSGLEFKYYGIGEENAQ